MIRLEHISKVFNAGTVAEVVALKEINLAIKKGEFVTLIGSNGSGKSTLLNLLAGSVVPDTGKIYINTTEVSNLAEHRRSKWIARVFQNPLAGTAAELSILENFRLASIRSKPKSLAVGTNSAFRKHVRDKIGTLGLGLENKLNQDMGTLSGGQRQALTILMSVMDDAELLLLDEPTAALDPKTSELIMNLADQLIRDHQLTAILVTHQLRDIPVYGSRVIQMAGGAVSRDIAGSEKAALKLADIYSWF